MRCVLGTVQEDDSPGKSWGLQGAKFFQSTPHQALARFVVLAISLHVGLTAYQPRVTETKVCLEWNSGMHGSTSPSNSEQ